MLTVSPFYHFNRAHYEGGYVGQPDPQFNPEDDRGSNYFGGVVSLAVNRGKHNARCGIQVFGARDNQLFGIVTSDGSNPPFSQREMVWGNVEAMFLEDQYKVTNWLTLTAACASLTSGHHQRKCHRSPRRCGLRVPHLNWVLRGFYGRTIRLRPSLNGPNSPLWSNRRAARLGFLPVRGERDEQHEFGRDHSLRGLDPRRLQLPHRCQKFFRS